jgi:hypothetical protein
MLIFKVKALKINIFKVLKCNTADTIIKTIAFVKEQLNGAEGA